MSRTRSVARLTGSATVLTFVLIAPLAARDNGRLVDAVRSHDRARVQALLDGPVDVNASEPDGATALHWAAHNGDRDMAALLIRAGAKPNAANDYGVVPLALAALNGDALMIEMLLDAGADPMATSPDGESVLMTAARSGDSRAVRALLAHGADPEHHDPARGQTALMWAVAERHLDVARALLAGGADVRARTKIGYTALLFAAQQGDLSMVELLMQAGTSANETAQDGTTALLVATLRGHWALANWLLDHDADPNADKGGYTALHWAVGSWETELSGMFGSESFSSLAGRQRGKLQLVKNLLAHGADPNARVVKAPPRFGFSLFNLNLVGATPFLLASMAGELEVMKLLLANGASPLQPSNGNTTPLMAAAGIGRVDSESRVPEDAALEVTRLAWELGGDVNAVNAEGETALHGAAYRGTDAVVRFLVDKGAKLDIKDKYGWTPLAIAEGVRHPYGGGIVVHKSTADLLRALNRERSAGAGREGP